MKTGSSSAAQTSYQQVPDEGAKGKKSKGNEYANQQVLPEGGAPQLEAAAPELAPEMEAQMQAIEAQTQAQAGPTYGLGAAQASATGPGSRAADRSALRGQKGAGRNSEQLNQLNQLNGFSSKESSDAQPSGGSASETLMATSAADQTFKGSGAGTADGEAKPANEDFEFYT